MTTPRLALLACALPATLDPMDVDQERECLCGARVLVDYGGGKWDRGTMQRHRCGSGQARLLAIVGGCREGADSLPGASVGTEPSQGAGDFGGIIQIESLDGTPGGLGLKVTPHLSHLDKAVQGMARQAREPSEDLAGGNQLGSHHQHIHVAKYTTSPHGKL